MKTKCPTKPRVLIPFNTGTRIVLSKKDKARHRRELNKMVKNFY